MFTFSLLFCQCSVVVTESSTPCQQTFPCCTICLVWLALGARKIPYGRRRMALETFGDCGEQIWTREEQNCRWATEIQVRNMPGYSRFIVSHTAGMLDHKVSPWSTDPVPLYSLYSKLQNVNIRFLDSRLGPTPSCLVAETS